MGRGTVGLNNTGWDVDAGTAWGRMGLLDPEAVGAEGLRKVGNTPACPGMGTIWQRTGVLETGMDTRGPGWGLLFLGRSLLGLFSEQASRLGHFDCWPLSMGRGLPGLYEHGWQEVELARRKLSWRSTSCGASDRPGNCASPTPIMAVASCPLGCAGGEAARAGHSPVCLITLVTMALQGSGSLSICPGDSCSALLPGALAVEAGAKSACALECIAWGGTGAPGDGSMRSGL